jgi:5-hydroxyisourate hydrolase-like protein (transthyretin family)
LAQARRTALVLAAVTAGGLLLAPQAHAEYYDTAFKSVSINGGKPIVMGKDPVTVPVTAEIEEDSGGLESIDAKLVIGGQPVFLEGTAGHNMTCEQTTATVSTCTGTAVVSVPYLSNSSPGPVYLGISGYAYDGAQYQEYTSYVGYEDLPGRSVPLLKQSTLTGNASPEPARKGGTLTVTGQLTRPDWQSFDASNNPVPAGYAGQSVRLQFKKTGGTSYSTVKTVTTDADGKLRTTVTATASGSWRWAFSQNSTSSAAVSVGDAVTLLKVSKLTADATPEPVAKGSKLTVKGRLTRATTDAATTFVGYGGQPVKLQFRKAGSSTYTTLKTVTTDSAGYLKTTATANAAGYWRWSYAGSSTVASVNAAGDYAALK